MKLLAIILLVLVIAAILFLMKKAGNCGCSKK